MRLGNRLDDIPASLRCIQTVSRAELLRQLAEAIQVAVASGRITPGEIAIIGPGVDAIARYALREMLVPRGIAVEALNEQRAIASSSTVRALLTLMGLVYPGLGRLINREEVAEMLVVLSQRPGPTVATDTPGSSNSPRAETPPRIDPVRAGLIVDHCFKPDPLHPELLPVEAFPRWDRLGYQGTQTYGDIRQWITTQQQQQQQRLLLNPVTLLDRAIQYFLLGGSHLPYDRLAILRE
ncbi:MAG: recombinase family protein, partial [Cyanobacteria bacterium P01_H01_bin.130]